MLNNPIDTELIDLKTKLLGSLLFFTQTFFKIRTGRDLIVSEPVGRESHHIIFSRELTSLLDLRTNKLIINVAPGSNKSEFCCEFVAWALAHYPDSNFIYISFSEERAAENTSIIRDIISLPAYNKLFGVWVDKNANAKSNFKTNHGGQVVAFGSSGSVTGANAGLPGLDRFSGALIMDDMHKPEEVFTDDVRNKVIRNYENTIVHRTRGINVPTILIGQRLHQDDLPAYLIKKWGNDCRKIILKTRDDNGNILYPEVFTSSYLDGLSDYAYAAQHQQNPIPAGGGIFKKNWFVLKEVEPKIILTFITVDTAETDKSYNDATVFSFWGLYKIEHGYTETDTYALHWIDCSEIRVEPADLEENFKDFYVQCLRYHTKPCTIAIEKKSMGVMLSSILKRVQGLDITDIERTKASGSKTTRFIEMQSFVKRGLISFPKYAEHTQLCLDHMASITDNNAHAHDDICDTAYDSVKMALIDQTIQKIYLNMTNNQASTIAKTMANDFTRLQRMMRSREW